MQLRETGSLSPHLEILIKTCSQLRVFFFEILFNLLLIFTMRNMAATVLMLVFLVLLVSVHTGEGLLNRRQAEPHLFHNRHVPPAVVPTIRVLVPKV